MAEEDSARLLLVEDQDVDAEVVRLVLGRSKDFRVSTERVTTLSEALAAVHDRQYDVVVLDLGLPDSSGVESVRKLCAAAPATPIVVFTGLDDDDLALAAIQCGAQEFLSKEHLMGHLLVRVIRHSIARQQQLLHAQATALTDALTGSGNRRAFDLEAMRRLEDWRREDTPFCMAMVDIDYFKLVNDRWGHDVGDDVLCTVAALLRDGVRETDIVTRFGGEEFAVILPATRSPQAVQVIERVRRQIADYCCEYACGQISVTVSCGTAEVAKGDDCLALLRRADEALYRAKQQGRNRCMLHNGDSAIAAVSNNTHSAA